MSVRKKYVKELNLISQANDYVDSTRSIYSVHPEVSRRTRCHYEASEMAISRQPNPPSLATKSEQSFARHYIEQKKKHHRYDVWRLVLAYDVVEINQEQKHNNAPTLSQRYHHKPMFCHNIAFTSHLIFEYFRKNIRHYDFNCEYLGWKRTDDDAIIWQKVNQEFQMMMANLSSFSRTAQQSRT